jgi:cytochrome b6-f complex iron-sulfur subunit
MSTSRPDSDATLPRRGVLRAGVVAFATIAVSGCASLFTKKRDPDITVAEAGGEARVNVAIAPWVKSGGPGSLVVAIEGRDDKVIVFRRPDGQIVATDMTCTHKGCDVNWDVSRAKLVCPCHGSEFTSTGAVMHGPAERPLAAHDVVVSGDILIVRVA